MRAILTTPNGEEYVLDLIDSQSPHNKELLGTWLLSIFMNLPVSSPRIPLQYRLIIS